MDHQLLSKLLTVDRAIFIATQLSQQLAARIKTLQSLESICDDPSFLDCLHILRSNMESLEKQQPNKLARCSESGVVSDLVVSNASQRETVDSLCVHLRDNVCLPILQMPLENNAADDVMCRLTVDVCTLTTVCVQHVGLNSQWNVVEMLVNILANSVNISSSRLVPIIHTLAKIYSFSNCVIEFEITNSLYRVLLNMLSNEDDQTVGCVLTLLIPAIISNAKSTQKCSEMVAQFWLNMVGSFEDIDKSDANIARILYILCGTFDTFLSCADFHIVSVNLINEQAVWTSIQQGFYHGDSVTRKRALYLFRRILDYAVSEICTESQLDPSESADSQVPRISFASLWYLRNVWQEFILLIEMLEEKQVFTTERCCVSCSFSVAVLNKSVYECSS